MAQRTKKNGPARATFIRRDLSDPGGSLGDFEACVARQRSPGTVVAETFGGVIDVVPAHFFADLWRPKACERLPSRTVYVERLTPVHEVGCEGERYTYIHNGSAVSAAVLRKALKSRGLRLGRMLNRFPCFDGYRRTFGLRFTVRGALREVV